jgi:DNA-binding HxlR family transcriptional regulator
MTKRKELSSNTINLEVLEGFCGIIYSMNLIGGRWKLVILCKLQQRKLRFSELRKMIPNITERVLTLQLKELEKQGLLTRTVYPEVPLRVEYELTKHGRSLSPIWLQLEEWGKVHKLSTL